MPNHHSALQIDSNETSPELESHYCGPLLRIESHIIESRRRIETWFREQWRRTPAPFYSSVDLRNAGYKLGPVDTNLFPAGFNNLNHSFDPLVVHAIQSAVEHACPDARGMLIIPERHTRNQFYLESLATMAELFELAGFETRIGSLEPLGEPAHFKLPSGRTLTQHPIHREGRRLEVDGFSPCTIVLNNDLSGGREEILDDLEQTVVPPTALGWWRRSKFDHFSHYQSLAHELAELIDLDPWHLAPMILDCGQIDFMKREGETCLQEKVGEMLAAIQKKYDELEIKEKPFVVIKADAGTYGMGVMMAQSPEEVTGLNRKQRTRMAASKDGRNINRVLIQEGIYSFERLGSSGHVAEPVLYMIDRHVVGGFYRVHTKKGQSENLNSPGAEFVPLPFTQSCVTPAPDASPDSDQNRLYCYGVVARLALLAAAREQRDLVGDPSENPVAD
ncbi:MAG: glutamate--cysteine ligase [Halothiobacillaceae bacterium]|nr:glutamate--cysteine ligase [Halothiobacillaceae bacterium]HER33864.1 glutamate--cysteine ligase [Halothiobacillaceae bacterium]